MPVVALSSGHVFARGSVVAITPLREQSYAEINANVRTGQSSIYRFVFDVVGVGFRVTVEGPWLVPFFRVMTARATLSDDEEAAKNQSDARIAAEKAGMLALRAEAIRMLEVES